MANDKLKELTDRLYNEGLSKGREEGDKILSDAKAEAAKIISDAKAKADKTIEEAERKAADIVSKADSDVKMASSQALQTVKTAIQEVILTKSVDAAVASVMGNEEFAKQIILAAAGKFSAENSCDLEVVLPAGASKNIADYVKNEVSKAVGKGIEVKTGKIKGGFNLAPKNGGYYISFSDSTFDELIKEYLRPATRKALFGE